MGFGWIFAVGIVVIVIKATSTNECKKKASLLGGEELICNNASITFFLNFNVPLNKTHWITCENCSLNVLDEDSFKKVSRNSVNYLYLIKSRIRVIKAFTFNKFNTLKVLSLRENSIDNLTSGVFVNLKKLIQLDLSRNEITILQNNLFDEIASLDLLNLNFNKIFYIQPEAFFGLKHLKYLYLNDNDLKKLEGHTFRHLINLLLLYLENNKITQIDPLAFTNLNALNSLYLNNNSINYLVQYNFKPLHSLSDLQLRNNNLTEIQVSSFNGLSNLRYLYLGKNRLKTIKPYGLIGLNNLQCLELIGNDFEIFDLEFLKNMENLSMLWLQHNHISQFVIDFKSDSLQSLESLGVENNNLTSLNFMLLHNKMPRIRDFFIANNTWKCEFLVNMFNFSLEKDFNLCVSADCGLNKTRDYIEKICDSADINYDEEDSDIVDSDFAVDSAEKHSFASFNLCVLLFVLMLVI